MDEIIKAHLVYIEKVLERCLMTNKVKGLVKNLGFEFNSFLIVFRHFRLCFPKVEVMRVGIFKVLKLAVKFGKLWTPYMRENRFEYSVLKTMSHGANFLATCNAILLLRDVNLANTRLHYILLMYSSHIKRSSLINIS